MSRSSPPAICRVTRTTYLVSRYPGNPSRENFKVTSFRITVKNLDPVECNDPPDFVYEESTSLSIGLYG